MKLATFAPQKYFNNIASPEHKRFFIEKLVRNFLSVGTLAFGQMKFIVPDSADEYNWEVLDTFVDFATKHNVEAHYNTVINNKFSFPDWYRALSSPQKVEALEKHIKTVIGRFGNRFSIYKLVNEMVRDEDPLFLGTELSRVDLITLLFKWAKETCPEATLLINDFAIIVREDIREAYINMINAIQEKGGPIDGVGIQGHLGHPSPYKTPLFQLPSDEMILKALEYVHSKTQLPIFITEFDVSYANSIENQYEGSSINPNSKFTTIFGQTFGNWYEYQAYAYKHFYELCKSTGFVEYLIFWGLLDSDTLPNERPGTGFFDEKNTPKPVYHAMKQILGIA